MKNYNNSENIPVKKLLLEQYLREKKLTSFQKNFKQQLIAQACLNNPSQSSVSPKRLSTLGEIK